MAIVVNLDVLLAQRKMSVSELAARVRLANANISILKNGRAKAIRFSTLHAICEALDCQPGDLLTWVRDEPEENPATPKPSFRHTEP